MSGDRANGGDQALGSECGPASPEDSWVMRVLLVEDHVVDALLLSEWLELEGLAWEVFHVQTFAAAASCWEGGGFGALLLDLALPDGCGLDLVGRGLALAGEVPVVVLSGLEDGAVAAQAVDLGARAYVVKGPGAVQDLRAVLEGSAGL